MCIRLEADIYKILAAEFKVGTAKLPSSMHVRLRNLRTGTQTEQRFHPETRVENISVETVSLEYSYSDEDNLYCLHPETFDTLAIPKRLVGTFERFLESGDKLKVGFFEDEPIDALVPLTVEAVVTATGAPLHGDIDAAPKSATLANGLEVQVPQFIKTGDRVKLDTATGKYLERVK
jgi:elongation factor P